MGKLEDLSKGVQFGFSSTAPAAPRKKSAKRRITEVSDLYKKRLDQLNDDNKEIPPYPFSDYQSEFTPKGRDEKMYYDSRADRTPGRYEINMLRDGKDILEDAINRHKRK